MKGWNRRKGRRRWRRERNSKKLNYITAVYDGHSQGGGWGWGGVIFFCLFFFCFLSVKSEKEQSRVGSCDRANWKTVEKCIKT